MSKIAFAVFFSIVLVVYGLINYWILKHGLNYLPVGSPWRKVWTTLVIVGTFAFFAGRMLERIQVNWLFTTLIWIGSFWMAIMVYLALQLLLIDIFNGLRSLVGTMPGFMKAHWELTKNITAGFILVSTLTLVLVGHINTWIPAVRDLNLHINKPGGNIDQLHIVAISDVHLGTTIEKRHMDIIIKKINELEPDIILIPGDIIDEDIRPVIHSNVGRKLLDLKSRYGVYAVSGNHEYIGGIDKAREYLTEHNIKLLNDTSVLIDNSFYVIGREDLTRKQFVGSNRKGLGEIVKGLDPTKPMILLDHQPSKLEQAEQNGIDLQLSGHTHHGQLWPFNYITKAIFEVSWGYKKKGNTHYYVSSGIGGWGPPVRTVNRPEIISIHLKFK